jgi:hypothetical protein
MRKSAKALLPVLRTPQYRDGLSRIDDPSGEQDRAGRAVGNEE